MRRYPISSKKRNGSLCTIRIDRGRKCSKEGGREWSYVSGHSSLNMKKIYCVWRLTNDYWPLTNIPAWTIFCSRVKLTHFLVSKDDSLVASDGSLDAWGDSKVVKDDRIAANQNRIVANRNRIAANRNRIVANCDNILTNCDRIVAYDDRILAKCDRIVV